LDNIDLIVIGGAAVAGFVQGLSGFAFGLVAMAFWVWALDPALAGPLVIFGGLVGQVLSLGTIRNTFTISRSGPIILGGALGVPLGVFLLGRIEPDAFKLFVGLVLAVCCPLMLIAKQLPKITAGGKAADAGAGLIGGIMGGLGGLCGPPPTLWAALRGWPRDDQRAVIQSFNLSMQVLTLGAYILSGLIAADMLRYFALVVPAMLIPNLIGNRLYARLGDGTFRRIVLVLLTLSGLAMIAAGIK
jgi:uncharacterized membrane protein YfcA